jgi:signal transduction histidine kinase
VTGGSAPSDAAGPVRQRSAARTAMLVCAVTGTVLALLLAVAVVLVVRYGDRQQSLVRADQLAATLANEVVGPAVRDADPQQVATLDQLLGSRVRDGSAARIKVWTPDGTVLWADDHRLIGSRYELEAEDAALLGTTESYAELTDLARPENEYEQQLAGSFIEVYAGFFDAQGDPLLFEAYLPADELRGGVLRSEVVGLSLVWLVVLLAVMLPLAGSLARRLDRAQADQQRLLRHAVEASELERKRLAQDLHDGVIQDLAGVGYVCSALEAQLTDHPQALATARRASAIIRRDVTALRTLSTDLYPPDLGGQGLQPALADLLSTCEQQGVATTLEVRDRLELTPPVALVAYRVVREALRNVVKHARATTVEVEVRRAGAALEVVVRDDGTGFDAAAAPPEGHLGLRVLRDSVTDAGGALDLRSSGSGTVLHASLPVA